MTTITICSSASFYRRVVELQIELEKLGYNVLIPSTAKRMRETGDFDVERYKTWFGDANDYDKKSAFIRAHFNEITKGNAVLVVNEEKNGKPNYIGGNVLMEMAIAFHLHQPIYLLNDIPEESPFLEEIIGMGSVSLGGDIHKLTQLTAAV